MKLVIGIVRPEKTNEVLEALYRAEVRGFSMSRVQGHGGELDRVETYRGTTVRVGLTEKVRFEIAVSDDFVEPDDRGAVLRRADRRGRRRQDLRARPRAGRAHPHRRDRQRRGHAGGCLMAPGVDAGDTAWMLAATALVLLMTPALGLFYAGLVRSKNTLNTFMMCVAALAVATITWALIGYSFAFAPGQRLHRRVRARVPGRRRLRAARGDEDPAPAVLRLPGDVLHRHDRAGGGRGGRADALRAVPGVRRAVVGARLRRARALGVRRRLAAGAGDAGLRRWRPGRDGLRLLARWPPRWWWVRGATTGARRSSRTTRCSCCSARGCCGSGGSASTAGPGSRRGNAGVLAFVNTLLTPGLRAGDLVRARPAALAAGDRDRRGDGDRRRLRRHHARRGLHLAAVGDGARRRRGAAELRA